MASVTVHGGTKYTKILAGIGDPAFTDEIMRTATAAVIRNLIVPLLISQLPHRTGTLRRSIKVVERRGQVAVQMAFYWRFQKIQGKPVADFVVDQLVANKGFYRDEIVKAARKLLRRIT